MKTLRFSVQFLLLFSILFSACHPDKKIEKSFLTIDKTALTEMPSAGTDKIIISSNVSWSLGSLPSWLTADKTSGTGNDQVTFTFTENAGLDTRSADVTISSSVSGVGSVTAKISQGGAAPFLMLDKTTAKEDSTGQTDSVTITTNTAWTLSVPTAATWITPEKTSGNAGVNKVHLTISANNTNQPKTADVTVVSASSSAQSQKLTLTQNPNYHIEGFSPTSATPGTQVTLTGIFGANPVVKVNGITASNVSLNTDGTQLTFTVPSGTTTGKISVTCDGGVSLTSVTDFTVINYTITSFSPTTGPIGIQVTLNGSFGPNPVVKVNGVTATIDNANSDASHIVFTIPSGATTGKISVTSGSSTITSTSDFSVIGVSWSKLFGTSTDEDFKSVVKTSDGGYIALGNTNNASFDSHTAPGSGDVIVVKVDANGQKQWSGVYGGAGFDKGISISTSSDGGYAVTGYTTSSNSGDFAGQSNSGGSYDAFLIKLNSSGGVSWAKLYGGAGDDRGSAVINTSDRGYAITGSSNSNNSGNFGASRGSYDAFIIKVDENGGLSWTKLYGGSNVDGANSITSSSDGGFVIVGSTQSNDIDFSANVIYGNNEIFILKTNSTGAIVWEKGFGGTGDDQATSVITASDGQFVLTGYSSSNDGSFSGMIRGGYDAFIMKLDGNGISFAKFYGSTGYEDAYSIVATSDGGYAITGSSSPSNSGDFTGITNHGSYDAYLFKVNGNGQKQWANLYGGTSYDYGTSLIATSDGGYVIAGSTLSSDGDLSANQGRSDAWIIKIK